MNTFLFIPHLAAKNVKHWMTSCVRPQKWPPRLIAGKGRVGEWAPQYLDINRKNSTNIHSPRAYGLGLTTPPCQKRFRPSTRSKRVRPTMRSRGHFSKGLCVYTYTCTLKMQIHVHIHLHIHVNSGRSCMSMCMRTWSRIRTRVHFQEYGRAYICSCTYGHNSTCCIQICMCIYPSRIFALFLSVSPPLSFKG